MNALTTQDKSQATIFKRLLAGKATKHTRQAYRKDLSVFASLLSIDLESIPDSA